MLNPLESVEQRALVQWLQLKKLDYFAVPNGGKRNKKEAMNMKAEGIKAGVSDLVIFLPAHILFLEIKRSHKSLSRVSKEQKEFISIVNDKYSYSIGHIAYGWKDAKQFIEGLI